MSRLTLSPVGIKRPLDISTHVEAEPPEDDAPSEDGASVSDQATFTPRARSQDRQPRRPARSRMQAVDASPPVVPAPARFLGGGRRLQTSIALDRDRLDRLDDLARAADVSLSALVVAALEAGLPADIALARELIAGQRVARAGQRAPRIECNLRIPEQLRVRLDELVSGVQRQSSRATRADLVNGTLASTISDSTDAQHAAELVLTFAQRREMET